MKPSIDNQLHTLRKKIRLCRGAERFRLQNKIRQLNKSPNEKKYNTLAEQIERSINERQRRKDNLPNVNYPKELPVSTKKDSILNAILNNQVVIICGETGSGKTTQLPKICLEAQRGIDGLIGHTQPRRIAARSVSSRIREEMNSQTAVGYKVRFNDETQPENYIKLMTDGILLAEIQEDRFLNQYDTLIIDEAHERSLNIDFLLGYMKWLLKRRKDLKLIITSATIDAERFSDHFDKAPVINVSGRTYPVEVRYRPLVRDDEDAADLELEEAIIEVVYELGKESLGDILIFLPGEREIRDISEALTQEKFRDTEILPLFARLSANEQNRIFQSHRGRRIVLSTNVAETSLTVPGIKYVIDSGLVRMSRYSWRARIQRLPIEATSQASANQRSGRCGRVSSGIAIRLYSEEDFNSRPEFTEPEILRTNLASVILQMESARIGDIESFPFLEPPDSRLIKDGYKLLFEVNAVTEQRKLTSLGRSISRYPIDPRLARMLIAADQLGALHEVLIIVSALAVQDPRERPMEKQQTADEKHARFKDETSDYLAYLNLWNYFHEQRKALSQNHLRKACKKEFISYLRMREWIDTHRQIKESLKDLRFNSQAASNDAIHQSLLTGLLSSLGSKDSDKQYLGANNRKFMIFPGSALKKKQPKWIMSAEIVETSQVYARTVAAIQPDWIERAAKHLLKHHYSEPHWEKKSAQVSALERISLYGLTIAAQRKVNYGRIDPKESREIFIRHALVYGEYHSKAPFFLHNRALVDDIENLEAKSRRRDLLIDEETLYDFYDEILPEHIYSGSAFEKWRKKAETESLEALFLTREKLLQRSDDHVDDQQYPDQMIFGDVRLPLSYHFEPGHEEDGITVTVPAVMLNQLTPEPFEYLIPGLLEDKITALIRAMPKATRKNFVPAPEYAKVCAVTLRTCDRRKPLLDVLGHELHRMTGISLPESITPQTLTLEPHLTMRFSVIDEHGKVIKAGRDLKALQQGIKHTTQKKFKQLPTEKYEKDGITSWDFKDLAHAIEITNHGVSLKTYPALVDKQDSVSIRLFDSIEIAAQQHINGLTRLLTLTLQDRYRYLLKSLPNKQRLCLHYTTLGGCKQLCDDIVMTAFRQSFTQAKTLAQITQQDSNSNQTAPILSYAIRSQALFEQLQTTGQTELVDHANDICHHLSPILERYQQIHKRMKGNIPFTWLEALNDIKEQISHLVFQGFVTDLTMDELRHIPRYLKGIERRLDKLEIDPAKDRALRVQIAPYWEHYKNLIDKKGIEHKHLHAKGNDPLIEYRWMLEEFRISLFAQELGTEKPVSAKRLDKLKPS